MPHIHDTIIVINSSKRPDKVITHDNFPEDVIRWVVAVPHDEYSDYLANFDKSHVKRLPELVPKCLSDQRQWVMDYYTMRGYRFVWLMDDDLVYLRRIDGTTKLRACDTQGIHDMFSYMRDQMEHVPYCGVSMRFGNNNIVGEYMDITRVYQSYIIDTAVFREVGAVFNPIPMFLGQDTHMSLSFLEAGHTTRVVGTYAFNEKTNAPGGCSEYRNAELARKCAIWMSDNHQAVSIKAKFTKTKWGLSEAKDGRRYKVDYLIQWQQAYNPVKEKPTGGVLQRLKGQAC